MSGAKNIAQDSDAKTFGGKVTRELLVQTAEEVVDAFRASLDMKSRRHTALFYVETQPLKNMLRGLMRKSPEVGVVVRCHNIIDTWKEGQLGHRADKVQVAKLKAGDFDIKGVQKLVVEVGAYKPGAATDIIGDIRNPTLLKECLIGIKRELVVVQKG